MDLNRLCLNCMREKTTQGLPCPFCAFDDTKDANPKDALPLWTVLQGTYLAGKKLGDGGFGITYTAFDMNLQKKVAIKEYFPYGIAARMQGGQGVICADNARRSLFESEKERFVKEAQILAGLTEQTGVVGVNYYFRENNTAYIVMEFVEGKTLAALVRERGGRIAVPEALALFRGVLATLSQIHAKGVVHEDISPDNIILTPEGKAKLIDFGAAHIRNAKEARPRVYKEHFSPAEQIEGRTDTGAWSDVYALCATIYFVITGETPVSAVHRKRGTHLPVPSERGVAIDALTEGALMYGLAVEPAERIRDAADLYYFFYSYGKEKNASVAGMQKKIKSSMPEVLIKKLQAEKKRDRVRTYMLFGGLAVLLFGLALLIAREVLTRQRDNAQGIASVDTNVTAVTASSRTAESVTGKDQTALGDAASAPALPDDAQLQLYRDELYRLAGKAKGSALERTAADCNRALVTQNHGTEAAWNEAMTKAVLSAMETQGTEGAGWVVLPVHEAFEEGSVLHAIRDRIDVNNAGIAHALTLEACAEIGVDVAVHADGTLFVTLLYR